MTNVSFSSNLALHFNFEMEDGRGWRKGENGIDSIHVCSLSKPVDSVLVKV